MTIVKINLKYIVQVMIDNDTNFKQVSGLNQDGYLYVSYGYYTQYVILTL